MATALIRRTYAPGDILLAEPVARALVGYDGVYFDAGQFDEIFWNHPVVRPGRPDGPHDLLSLDGAYEAVYASILTGTSPRRTITELYMRHLGLGLPDAAAMTPRLYLTPQELAWGRELLGDGDWCIVYLGYPGGPNRRGYWPLAEWQPVLRHARHLGLRTALVGKTLRGWSGEAASAEIDLDLRDRTSLRQLFAVTANAAYYLGNEGFPMLVAQAFSRLGVAVVNARVGHDLLCPAASSLSFVHRADTSMLEGGEIIKQMRPAIKMI